jgi:hypothetical protein
MTRARAEITNPLRGVEDEDKRSNIMLRLGLWQGKWKGRCYASSRDNPSNGARCTAFQAILPRALLRKCVSGIEKAKFTKWRSVSRLHLELHFCSLICSREPTLFHLLFNPALYL